MITWWMLWEVKRVSGKNLEEAGAEELELEVGGKAWTIFHLVFRVIKKEGCLSFSV